MMIRRLKWLAFTTALISLVYGAYEMNIEPAKNLSVFFLWVFFALSFMAFNVDVRNSIRAKGRSVPAWLSTLAETAVLLILVSNGEFVLGAIWLLTTVFISTIYFQK